MATVTTQSKISAALKVVTGTTETGAQKVASQNIGSLNTNTTLDADKDKIFTIANLIGACLDNLIARIEVTSVNLLTDDA